MFKKVLSAVGLLIITTGCSDKEHKDDQPKAVSSNTPKIEIVQNTKQHQIKVEEKAKNNKPNSYYLDYDQRKIQEKDMISTRTVIDAYTHIRSPYERVKISLIRQQLGKNFKLKRSACHDDYANGVVGPSLLGKNSDFIYKKIVEFKTTKKNPLMTELINQMSDDEIKQIAKEIYEFNSRVQQLGARE